jgi:hypothetical protein
MPRAITHVGQETQMFNSNRNEDGTAFTTGAKAVSLFFVVGMIALLAGHTTATPGDDARDLAATVSLEPTREIPVVGLDLPLEPASPDHSAAAAAAVLDDPPVATF